MSLCAVPLTRRVFGDKRLEHVDGRESVEGGHDRFGSPLTGGFRGTSPQSLRESMHDYAQRFVLDLL